MIAATHSSSLTGEVLTCQTRRGVCAKGYGRDVARGNKVTIMNRHGEL